MISSRVPALLGGAPTFQPSLAFTRPAVPPFAELAPEFEEILNSGGLTKGPRLAKLEAALQDHLRSPNVVCVNSCTSGLILGIQSLKLSGEVIVPSFSFMASFHALKWNNLTPVFVDCLPYALTVDLAAVRAAVTPRTCAIMSAYVFGNPPYLVELDQLAKELGLAHFCDSAHGIGTLIDGAPAGNHGDFEVFSCSPTKLLTAAEGGVVSTRRPEIAQWIRSGRDYGNPGSYDCDFAGLNARMSEFHAAIMLAGLPRLESYVQARQRLVDLYQERLKHLPGLRFQEVRPGVRSSHKDFPIFIEAQAFGLHRNQLQKALLAEGIPTRAYFDPPGHQLTCYKQTLDLPVTLKMCAEVLCLPMSSLMTEQEAERVCQCLIELQQQAPALAKAAALE
ncbi:DegT/DnrJ/EryC1/StrS family aminotransferase [bacterium]|nr:DegT/DnrJ/EryC1/StrS family aminotransferase [bacterium]